MSVLLVCLWCVLIALGALWCVTSRRRRPPLACGALPLLGHCHLILKNHAQLYTTLVEDIGYNEVRRNRSAFTLRFGIFDQYVIIDPDFALLLMNTCLKRDILYKSFVPIFGKDGLVTAGGTVWRQHRKLLNPIFNQNILNRYLVEMNKHSRRFAGELTTFIGKGSFEHFKMISQFLLNLVLTMAVGQHDDDLQQKCWHLIDSFSDGMIERFLKFWLHNEFIYGLSALKKKQEHVAKTAKEMLNELIEKRKKLSKEHRGSAYLDHLLELAEDGALPYSTIVDELSTFLVGSADTTATAFSYALLIIGSHPDVQQKIFDELDELFGDSDRDVDKQDIQKLKYTEAVIKETMRVYPTVPLLIRELETDLVYQNYTLPAGSRCTIGITSILRHPVWGHDAEQFRPERWLAPAQLPPAHAFAAFGMGKRNCIGGAFAMMMMKTALVHILRHYRISGDVTKLVQKMGVVVKPVSGCYIEIERRHVRN